jgi:ATP-dependent 26S proteasome regulatory subunit
VSQPQVEDGFIIRARALLEAAIRRRWRSGLITRDQDGLLTSMLGAAHIENVLQQANTATRHSAGPGTPADAAPVAAAIAPLSLEEDSPIALLAARLGLSTTEVDLLAVLLSCEADPVTTRLMAYLSGNQVQFTPTVDLLLETIYAPSSRNQSEAAKRLHLDLGGRRPLRRLRIVLVEGGEQRVAPAQAVRLHPRAVAWMMGAAGVDPDLSAVAQIHREGVQAGEFDPDLLQAVQHALEQPGRLLLIDGPRRSGRELLLRTAAERLGYTLLVVQGRALAPDKIVAAFRDAILHGALLVLAEGEEALSPEGLLRFRECLEVWSDTVTILSPGRASPHLTALRPTTLLRVEVPEVARRTELWRQHLGEETDLSDNDLLKVAGQFNLGLGGIVAAVEVAKETARFSGRRTTRADIASAVRQLFDADLSTVATRVNVRQRWQDLVLPEDLSRSLVSILDRILLKTEVFGQWGFDRKLGKGLGLTVLLSGPPGTGKSMAASLIAAELGLDLYVINLAELTSKWLGETEKNLARAFDAAESGHVLLLFDEADSILGKRSSEMKGANDRYANLGTNFILTRLEYFQGTAFFTTNLSSALDPAVSRRMTMQLTFPFPDEAMRAELWRSMIPEGAPLSDDVDFQELAARYEVTGGVIRNLVLRAAFAAARDKRPINMAYLVDASQQEYHDRGSLLTGGRLS